MSGVIEVRDPKDLPPDIRIPMLEGQLRQGLSTPEKEAAARKELAALRKRANRQAVTRMSMDEVRSHAIRCLHPLASLEKKDRLRVLRHAEKMSEV